MGSCGKGLCRYLKVKVKKRKDKIEEPDKDKLKAELYSVLIHEATHLRDLNPYSGKVDPGSSAYYNKPTEVRAFMQQVVDEVAQFAEKYAKEMEWFDADANMVSLALENSRTWGRVKAGGMTKANQRKIMQAVWRDLKLLEPGLKTKYQPRIDYSGWDPEDIEWAKMGGFKRWAMGVE